MLQRIGLYRLGVEALRKLIDMSEDLCDRFALPADALLGALKLTVTGGRQVFIDNHKGILSYSDERVLLSTGKGKLLIYGQALRLETMTAGQLLINGKIQRVEWE